jgi:hypothetical protein
MPTRIKVANLHATAGFVDDLWFGQRDLLESFFDELGGVQCCLGPTWL